MTEEELFAAYQLADSLDGPQAAQDGPGAAEPPTGVPVAMHEELRALVALVAGLWGHLDARLDQLEAQLADTLDAHGLVIEARGDRRDVP
jgi:hypothetical protein